MIKEALSKVKAFFSKKSSAPAWYSDPRYIKLTTQRKLRITAVRQAILEGWDYKEIAKLLDMEVGSVRQDAYLLRGLNLLKEDDYIHSRPCKRKKRLNVAIKSQEPPKSQHGYKSWDDLPDNPVAEEDVPPKQADDDDGFW